MSLWSATSLYDSAHVRRACVRVYAYGFTVEIGPSKHLPFDIPLDVRLDSLTPYHFHGYFTACLTRRIHLPQGGYRYSVMNL